MTWPGGEDGHLGDLASALLDGELDGAERVRCEAHLERCATCRQVLRRTTDARAWIRALPVVDTPSEDRPFAAPRWAGRRASIGVANVAGAAAVWLLVVTAGSLDPSGTVSPSVAPALSGHQAALVALPQPSHAEAAALSHEFALPRAAAHFELAQVTIEGSAVQALYSDGVDVVSVHREQGALDWDALPMGAQTVAVGDAVGALVQDGDLSVLFVEREPWVYTVVAPTRSGLIADVAEAMPSQGHSLVDRVGDATRSLVDCFGLRG